MSYIFKIMDEHEAKIGLQDTVEIAEFSLFYVQKIEQKLSQCLIKMDYATAAKEAHTAISSVRLYGTPKLESLLLKIMNNDYETKLAAKLQHDLSTEFILIHKALTAWLARHG